MLGAVATEDATAGTSKRVTVNLFRDGAASGLRATVTVAKATLSAPAVVGAHDIWAKTFTAAGALVGAGLSTVHVGKQVMPPSALTMSHASVMLVAVAGATPYVDVVVEFRTKTVVPNGGYLKVLFGDAWDLSAPADDPATHVTSSVASTGHYASDVAGDKHIRVTVNDVGSVVPTVVKLGVTRQSMDPKLGASGLPAAGIHRIAVHTMDAAGSVLDVGELSVTTASKAVLRVGLSPSAAAAGQTPASWTLAFTVKTALEAGDWLRVRFPDGDAWDLSAIDSTFYVATTASADPDSLVVSDTPGDKRLAVQITSTWSGATKIDIYGSKLPTPSTPGTYHIVVDTVRSTSEGLSPVEAGLATLVVS